MPAPRPRSKPPVANSSRAATCSPGAYSRKPLAGATDPAETMRAASARIASTASSSSSNLWVRTSGPCLIMSRHRGKVRQAIARCGPSHRVCAPATKPLIPGRPKAFLFAGAVAATVALALAAPAAASHGLVTGFAGPLDPQDLNRMLSAGAGTVAIQVNWAGVAPQRPLLPESPADPAYDFARLDREVSDATAAGLRVILD